LAKATSVDSLPAPRIRPIKADRRSNHYSNFTKVRTGSTLKKTQSDLPPPDLRGDYERRRDYQVVLHFTRLARLDLIAKLATDGNDTELSSQVTIVRRAELERFRVALDRLRRSLQVRLQAGAAP